MNPPSMRPARFPDSGLTYHPALGNVRYSIQEISDEPDHQVLQTISLMRQYVGEDAADRALQEDTVRASETGDPITDTWNYLRRRGQRGMRFVRDEETAAPFAGYEFAVPGRWRPMVESLARPELLAKTEDPHGDCDCFCMYGAAHLYIKGIPAAFVTVAADASDPSIYTHVYLVAYPVDGPYAGRRVPMDLSHGPYPGWETSPVYRKREWPILSHGAECLLSMGALVFGSAALFLGYRALRRAA